VLCKVELKTDMAYIGTQPTVGLVTKLNDITSGFNSSTTTFQLSLPPGGTGNNFTPGSVYQIIVSLGGVIQNPNTDYTLNGSQITFTTAPASGLTCFIIALGQSINVGTPGAGTVTASSLSLGTGTPGQTYVINPAGTAFVFGNAGGASGGGTDQIFYLNGQSVTTDYTVAGTYNAMTAGPIQINTGITVTISTGAVWTIV
jgi:hypothetical protein